MPVVRIIRGCARVVHCQRLVEGLGRELVGPEHLEGAVEIVTAGHHVRVAEIAGVVGELVRVGVGLVLAGLCPRECRAGQSDPEDPSRVGHAKRVMARRRNARRDASSVVEELVVGDRARRGEDRRPLRCGAGGSLEEQDHSEATVT